MPCSSNVAAIEAFCGTANAPMLDRKLYITTGAKVSSIASATSHVVSTDITMVSAQVFYAWNFSKEESSYESTQDENGMWQTTAKIFIEQMASGKSHILNGMNGDNYIAIVVDKNGNKRLVGDPNNGCTVRVKEQTTPKNGYEVTISWSSAVSPYFYTGAIAV